MKTEHLNYGKTFVIGLGFFTTAMCWALYNAYVPIFLRKFISSSMIIGFIMTVDNWAAIVIQPWIGALSDKTNTRLGRRMPYIALGIPLAALFFMLIPYFLEESAGTAVELTLPLIGRLQLAPGLLPLFIIIMLFNIGMALYRAPVVSLMPDVTPSRFRSKANGVINLMGGVGSILAYLVGSFLYDLGVAIPFVTAAGVMVLALIVLLIFIREPRSIKVEKKGMEPGIINSVKDIFREREWSVLFIMTAIFFWFAAFNAMETWFTTYGIEVLHIKESAAARILTSISLFFVISALPAGFIGTRLGRRKTIFIGLVLFILVLCVIFFVRSIPLLYLLFSLAGVAWALINVNSITIVWELASAVRIGTYTGLYYFFSSLGQMVSPPLAGFVTDRLGMISLFPYSIVFFLFALLMMFGVKKGEALSAEEEAEKEKFKSRHIDLE
ncbi:MAG TPA: MFS transporter [Spirochaetales bacterium]|nr:MFS transporter [Spirochaetales bacterium]